MRTDPVLDSGPLPATAREDSPAFVPALRDADRRLSSGAERRRLTRSLVP